MRKLVLQVRRGGVTLGSWSLNGAPLELSLRDPDSGAEVAVFTARAPALPSEPRLPFHGELPRLDGDDLTMPLPDPGGPSLPPAREQGDDLTMPLPDLTDTGKLSAPSARAEVWRRVNESWEPAGQLPPGHQVTAYGGSVALRRDGTVVVKAGSRLQGSATLPDGRVQPIDQNSPPQNLPAGTTIMLRRGEQGIYVRSTM